MICCINFVYNVTYLVALWFLATKGDIPNNIYAHRFVSPQITTVLLIVYIYKTQQQHQHESL